MVPSPGGDQPGLPTVISALQAQPFTPEVQAWGCAALRNITQDAGTCARRRSLELGALDLVLAALKQHSQSAQVQECGCAALGELAKDVQSRGHAISLGAIDLALSALKQHPAEEEVQRWGLSALGELLRHGETAGAVAVKGGCLELALVAMQLHPGASQVQACSCALLALLALFKASAVGVTVADIDSGARSLLYTAMHEHLDVEEVQACGCSAIGALAVRGSADLQRALVNDGGFLEMVIAALSHHPGSLVVQERGCSALRCLLLQQPGSTASDPAKGHAAVVTRALELGAAGSLVDALQNHPGIATVQAAALTALLCLAMPTVDDELASCQVSSPALLPPATPQVCDEATLLQALLSCPEVAVVQHAALALLWGRLVANMAEEPENCVGTALQAMQALRLHPSLPRVQALACLALSYSLRSAWARVCVSREEFAKYICRALSSYGDDPAVQEHGWRAMLVILEVDGLAAFDHDLLFKLPQLLLATMAGHPQSALQQLCCECISCFCLTVSSGDDAQQSGQEDLCRSLLALGATGLVCAALEAHPTVLEMQEAGCAALQALAGHDSSGLHSQSGEKHMPGALEAAILSSLQAQPESLAVQIRGMDLLSAVAAGSTVKKGAGGLVAGVDLALRSIQMHQFVQDVFLIAAETLVRLLACDPGREEGLEPMAVIASTLVSMTGQSPDLPTKTVLRHMGKLCPDVATRIVALNGVDLLLQVMSVHPDSETLQVAATRLLETLAARCSPARGRLLMHAAALEPVLHAMSHHLHSAGVQLHCCALLTHLSADRGRMLPELAERCLELVLSALQAHPGDVLIDTWGCIALQNMCFGADLHGKFEELGALGLVVQNMHLTWRSRPRPASAKSVPETQEQTRARCAVDTFQAICVVTLYSFAIDDEGCCGSLASGQALQLLRPVLEAPTALEVRERACHLLCKAALGSEEVLADFAAAGPKLWVTVLGIFREHLAAAEAEEAENGLAEEALPEIRLMLPSPSQQDDGCQLVGKQICSPSFIVDAMRVLPSEPRVQATACVALRRQALLAARNLGRDRVGMIQNRLRAEESVVAALRAHETAAEVQQRGVAAIQALLCLACSEACETEDEAIQKAAAERDAAKLPAKERMAIIASLHERIAVAREAAALDRLLNLGLLPLLMKALCANPANPTIQEHGLDVLRVLCTGSRRPDAVAALPDLGAVQAVIEGMNVNIARPKILEYGCTLLAEISWMGAALQNEVAQRHGVPTVVRALKGYPNVCEVQLAGLSAVQALSSNHEANRNKFFSEDDILQLVVEAVQNFPRSEPTQAFGLAALLSLVHTSRDRTDALASLNGQTLADIGKAWHIHSKRVQEIANQLIAHLGKFA